MICAIFLRTNEAFSAPSSLILYCYPQNDLGAVYRPESTTIKLWAPTAKTVSVEIFDDATTTAFSLAPMVSDSNGIWSVARPIPAFLIPIILSKLCSELFFKRGP